MVLFTEWVTPSKCRQINLNKFETNVLFKLSKVQMNGTCYYVKVGVPLSLLRNTKSVSFE